MIPAGPDRFGSVPSTRRTCPAWPSGMPAARPAGCSCISSGRRTGCGRRPPGESNRPGERVQRRLHGGGLAVPFYLNVLISAPLVGEVWIQSNPGRRLAASTGAGCPDDQHWTRSRTMRCRWPWSRASGRRLLIYARLPAPRPLSPWRSLRDRATPTACSRAAQDELPDLRLPRKFTPG